MFKFKSKISLTFLIVISYCLPIKAGDDGQIETPSKYRGRMMYDVEGNSSPMLIKKNKNPGNKNPGNKNPGNEAQQYIDSLSNLDSEENRLLQEKGLENYPKILKDIAEGKEESAIDSLSAVLSSMEISNPEKPRVYNTRGAAYVELGKLKDAIEDFDSALKLADPSNIRRADVFYSRADAKYRGGDFKGAKIDLEEVLKIENIDNQLKKDAKARLTTIQNLNFSHKK